MKEILNKYENYLRTQGRSENTIKNYCCDLNKFIKYFEEVKGQGDVFYSISVIDLMEYVNYIKFHCGKNNTEANPKTINRNISTLKKFYEWMKKCNIIHYNDMKEIEFVSTPKNQSVIYMDLDESKCFMRSVITGQEKKERCSDFAGARDELMFKIYLDSGLRCEELLDVKLNDIYLKKKMIKIRSGKGDKERYVPITDKTIELYYKYMKVREKRNKNNSDYLILNNRGGQMSKSGVLKLTKYYAKNSQLNSELAEKITPHKLRHSFATIQSDLGTPISTISKTLGHSKIATTQNIYIHLDTEKMLNATRENSKALDNY